MHIPSLIKLHQASPFNSLIHTPFWHFFTPFSHIFISCISNPSHLPLRFLLPFPSPSRTSSPYPSQLSILLTHLIPLLFHLFPPHSSISLLSLLLPSPPLTPRHGYLSIRTYSHHLWIGWLSTMLGLPSWPSPLLRTVQSTSQNVEVGASLSGSYRSHRSCWISRRYNPCFKIGRKS